MKIKIKRAYDEPEPSDGTRILIDRLWPRGVSKEEAHLDLWLKEAAPSTELRQWFAHDPARWTEFQRRYRRELSANPEAVRQLTDYASKGTLTLVYGARDQEHNDAVVLKAFLEDEATEHPAHSKRGATRR